MELVRVGFELVTKVKSLPRTTRLLNENDSPGGASIVTFRSKSVSWFLKLRSLR